MISRAQKLRLAVFLLIGFSILLFIIILLLGSRITERRDYYQIVFEETSVFGLQIGSAVLYRGIRIGRVENIEIDRNRISDIIVSISVIHGTPIKADQEATMIMVGITGLKQIELRGGTNASAFLKSGDTIPTGRTLMDDLTDRAEAMAYRVEAIMDNLIEFTNKENQERFASILENINKTVSETQNSIVNTILNVNDITTELNLALVVVSDILVKLDNVMDQERLNTIMANTETITTRLAEVDYTQVGSTIELLNESIQRITLMISRIDSVVQRNSPDLTAIVEELRETMENLNEFTRIITEDPSILIRSRRHN
ncbi:MAG: MlaD family protein [Candidatus Cloacimonetes bacterium]|nr:MlaD family protein [Candidatus Cloacimonadota bacterium]